MKKQKIRRFGVRSREEVPKRPVSPSVKTTDILLVCMIMARPNGKVMVFQQPVPLLMCGSGAERDSSIAVV
jgi:hypothetical protein